MGEGGESTVMAVSAFRASFRIGDGLFQTVILEVCVDVVGGDGRFSSWKLLPRGDERVEAESPRQR